MTPLPSSPDRHLRLVGQLAGLAAVVTLALLATVIRPDVDPATSASFGRDTEQVMLSAVAACVAVGVLVSLRWPFLGATTIALAALLVGIFVALEFSTITLILVTSVVALPAALLWLDWQRARSPLVTAASLVLGLAVLTLAGLGAAEVNDYYQGPTHPSSDTPGVRADMVEWVWSGALEADGVLVVAGLVDDLPVADVSLVVEPVGGGTPVRVTSRVAGAPAHRLQVSGLEADTEYAYVVEVDGRADAGRGRGRFRTAPLGAGSFRVVVSSCARTGSNGAVFDAVVAEDPLLYLNLGDIHYGNVSTDDLAAYHSAFERLLTQPAQAALYRRVPLAYVWDDHDYGDNDSGGDAPGREAVRRAYRQMVPHYPLVAGAEAAINQAFTIGRVRFVLTDSRSERTGSTMLGAAQLAWLVDELVRASSEHALVVWGNPVPWNGESDPGADGWQGFPDERRLIADALAEAGVDNLVMLSADAHMVALDDGTNTDFSSDGSGGFPLLHAAALDRRGEVKGGPYSAGAFPGTGQYGVMDVVDDGATIFVTLAGKTWDGKTLVQQTFEFP